MSKIKAEGKMSYVYFSDKMSLNLFLTLPPRGKNENKQLLSGLKYKHNFLGLIMLLISKDLKMWVQVSAITTNFSKWTDHKT